MNPPSVSVIIPTFYRYDTLGPLLAALAPQSRPPDEVLVADQTPIHERPPEFYDVYRPSLPLRVIDIDRPSITRPRNIAAREARGDVLIFLDDDVILGSDFVAAHLRVLERERVDVVNGGVSLSDRLPVEYPWDVRTMDPVRFFLAAPNHEWRGMMLGVSSCNFSIKRSVFLAVGGFDEYLPRMVDFELGYRLWRHGAKIYYDPEPFTKHLRASTGGSRRNPAAHNRLVAQLYIHRKHFPGWITRQFELKYMQSAWFRKRNLIEPWAPFQRSWTLLKANRSATALLAEHRSNSHAGNAAP